MLTKTNEDCRLLFARNARIHLYVRKMLQPQSLEGNQTGTVLDLPGGAIGWIETADRFSSIPRIYRSPSGNILLVAGVPIDVSGGDVKSRLSGSLEAGAEDLPPS